MKIKIAITVFVLCYLAGLVILVVAIFKALEAKRYVEIGIRCEQEHKLINMRHGRNWNEWRLVYE